MKARTVVERGENGLLNEPGPELRLGPGKERKKRAKIAAHGTSKSTKKTTAFPTTGIN